jgi:hypothetical protein
LGDALVQNALSQVNGKVIWPILGKKVVFTQFALNAPFMLLLFGWIGALEVNLSAQFPDLYLMRAY